ncbi:hypothetical protein COLO4_24463 [Corchorus olitorius]|uniref:Uncharacterized protein n=1 Tax=Corchorus olitorius TaxID=93759 RepID=A0A1R3I9S8_9ROSI|nr:hypothetical protein COLO4_24463 [Corchorus olitorius]
MGAGDHENLGEGNCVVRWWEEKREPEFPGCGGCEARGAG